MSLIEVLGMPSTTMSAKLGMAAIWTFSAAMWCVATAMAFTAWFTAAAPMTDMLTTSDFLRAWASAPATAEGSDDPPTRMVWFGLTGERWSFTL